tara:strand:+ start:149 stop:871 length:723 start_codon:yes stop_codon:yes gene_type:complete
MTRNNIENYIRTSAEKTLSERREYTLFNSINVFIKEPLTEDIDLTMVLAKVEKVIPRSLTSEIDVIVIGQFDFLLDREATALFKDGAIYVSNEQKTEDGLVEDLIHEISHAVELTYREQIYQDQTVKQEFLGKRKRLFNNIKYNNLLAPDIAEKDFLNIDFSPRFDMFLYRDVGYATLRNLIMGLFVSPYGATSIREYFANSFEEYYMGDRNYLKTISPTIYQKIEQIDYTSREQEYENY